MAANRFDDTTPAGVPPPELAVHPENRPLVDVLTAHVLAMKSVAASMRVVIHQLWSAKEPIAVEQSLSLERAFIEMSGRCLRAAADIAACRKDPPP